MAAAAAALKRKEVSRIIFNATRCRSRRTSWFLPGDLQDKVDPYLRPLYDALYDILGVEVYQKCGRRELLKLLL